MDVERLLRRCVGEYKEVMFLSALVCLSVINVTQNVINGF